MDTSKIPDFNHAFNDWVKLVREKMDILRNGDSSALVIIKAEMGSIIYSTTVDRLMDIPYIQDKIAEMDAEIARLEKYLEEL